MRTSLLLLLPLSLALLAGCGPAGLDPAGGDAGPPRADAGPPAADGGPSAPDAGPPAAADAGAAAPAADAGTALGIDGSYDIRYQLDLGAFTAEAAEVVTLLAVLQGVLDGGPDPACGGEPSLEAQLRCLAHGASRAPGGPPPWLGELVALLANLVHPEAGPLRAAGVLVLSGQGTRLAASETWTSLSVRHRGRDLELLDGAPGGLRVTLPPFGGTRDGAALLLGPRRVELDADRLLGRLLGAAIAAGSGGRAHDVAGLLDLVVCRPLLGEGRPEALACLVLTRALAERLERRSRPAVLAIAAQTAPVLGGRKGGLAGALGTAASPGTLRGELVAGPRAWPLGPAPGTAWHGTRRGP